MCCEIMLPLFCCLILLLILFLVKIREDFVYGFAFLLLHWIIPLFTFHCPFLFPLIICVIATKLI